MLQLLLLFLVLFLVWYTRKLTLSGTLTAGILAVVIYLGCGWPGIALLGCFFVLGTAVTVWRKKDKIQMGVSEAESSRRTAGQVLANGGVAGALGAAAWWWPEKSSVLLLMMAGAFAAAAADTLASELGVLYGKHCFNIRTFRPDQKGLNGVVSWEGTCLGMVGALLLGLALWATSGVQALAALVFAGTAGNLLDSWLGAVYERYGRLSNDAVNLANTLAGAMVMGLLFFR